MLKIQNMQHARPEVVHCGYLKKAPMENRSSLLWRNRWFVLLDSERVMADGSKLVRLEYYKDKETWTNGKEYTGKKQHLGCNVNTKLLYW